MLTPATDYITQLTWLGIFNCFLVREPDGFTLIDTLVGGNAGRIIDGAAKLGAPIRRIAITHAHSDHVGSLQVLAERLPSAQRYISARDGRFLAGERHLDPNEPPTKLRGNFQTVPVPMQYCQPGDRVGSLRVVASPGHTLGHVCFLDERDQTLLVGDAFSTLGGVATATRPYHWFPPPGANTWSAALAQQSAEALVALRPVMLLAGHGKPVAHPVAQMSDAVRRTAFG